MVQEPQYIQGQMIIDQIVICPDCDSTYLLENKTFRWCVACGWEQRLRPSASQRRNMADSVDG